MTTAKSRNRTKDTIKINERYELRYFLSPNIPSKQFGRKISIQLLELTENGKKDVLRVDNSHSEKDGSGRWPIHIHKPSGGLHMFIGASIEEVINVFIKYASEIMSNKDLEDLKISLKKLPFREMP